MLESQLISGLMFISYLYTLLLCVATNVLKINSSLYSFYIYKIRVLSIVRPWGPTGFSLGYQYPREGEDTALVIEIHLHVYLLYFMNNFSTD